jgi:hypothetical protein
MILYRQLRARGYQRLRQQQQQLSATQQRQELRSALQALLADMKPRGMALELKHLLQLLDPQAAPDKTLVALAQQYNSPAYQQRAAHPGYPTCCRCNKRHKATAANACGVCATGLCGSCLKADKEEEASSRYLQHMCGDSMCCRYCHPGMRRENGMWVVPAELQGVMPFAAPATGGPAGQAAAPVPAAAAAAAAAAPAPAAPAPAAPTAPAALAAPMLELADVAEPAVPAALPAAPSAARVPAPQQASQAHARGHGGAAQQLAGGSRRGSAELQHGPPAKCRCGCPARAMPLCG